MAHSSAVLERGLSLHEHGHLEKALKAYRRVAPTGPEGAAALVASALIYRQRGERDQAERQLRRSLDAAPSVVAYATLGGLLLERRRYDEAIVADRAALSLDPTNASVWCNLLFSLDLHPLAGWEQKLAERRHFDALVCAPLTAAAPPHDLDPDPERVLRVGYVSADFRQHSAASTFGPLLAGHTETVAVTLYDVGQDAPDAEDSAALGFRAHAGYVDATGMSDAELAARIRADRCDILVDLGGYAAGGRPLLFARKPAPIQITGFGHATGTGLACMDYLLGDPITTPRGHEDRYGERLLRVPILMAYDASAGAPEIAAPPALATGSPTFGYLGRAVKVSDRTLAVWARILARLPDARLVIKSPECDDPAVSRSIAATLGALGVPLERVTFRGASSRHDHLEAYNAVDVHLDPFPHGGGVTTVEASLMGVPTVTLAGESVAGRLGAAILGLIGQSVNVTLSETQYVERAVLLAETPGTLEERRSLHLRMATSIMTDPARYAGAVESAYRACWRDWCAQRTGR